MSVHGGAYYFVFLSEGKLLGVGDNSSFQISPKSDLKKISTPIEIEIPGNEKILKFNSGIGSSTTIVLTQGGLYGCGLGSYGIFGSMLTDEIGNVIDQDRKSMRLVEFYRNKQVKDYWCQNYALWVLMCNGKVFRSGWNRAGELANGDTADILIPEELDRKFLFSDLEVAVDFKGYSHTILLTDHGRVYGTGDGNSGRRGMGPKNTNDRTSFVRIDSFRPRKNDEKVTQICVGDYHSVFLSLQGFCYSCGSAEYGAIGHNDKVSRYFPTIITSLKNVKITKICATEHTSMFLTKEHFVFGCGRNDYYQTGLETDQNVLVPSRVKTALQIADIATGRATTMFLTTRGDVFSVGSNMYGQCGVDIYSQGGATGSIYSQGGGTGSTLKCLTKTKIKVKMLGNVTLFPMKPVKLSDIEIFTQQIIYY